jgi:hypothetical protein
MAQDYASSIQAVAIRVTSLQSDGSLATGPSASYVLTSDLISVSFTAEYEEGDEFVQKGGDGTVCTSYKAPDTLKRVTLEVAICNPDPEFSKILAGGELLTEGSETVGYAMPPVGVDGNPYGAAIEVWSKAIQGGKPASSKPYWHWVFPYVIARPGGDRVLENGILANSFEGWGVGNSEFDDGPDGSWPFISDRAFQYARTNTAPVGLKGFQTVAP